jgi:hypothetical protein
VGSIAASQSTSTIDDDLTLEASEEKNGWALLSPFSVDLITFFFVARNDEFGGSNCCLGEALAQLKVLTFALKALKDALWLRIAEDLESLAEALLQVLGFNTLTRGGSLILQFVL